MGNPTGVPLDKVNADSGYEIGGTWFDFLAPLRKREYSKKIIGKLKYTRKRLYIMRHQQLAEPF